MPIKKTIFSMVCFAIALGSSMAAEQAPATALLSQGRVDDAIVALQKTLRNTPNDAESNNLLCRAHYTLGNWDRGIDACEKAVALEPDNSQYHLWLGRVYGEKASRSNFVSASGLAKKLRREFETAVQLNPGNAEARVDLAEFYIEAPSILGGGKAKAEAQADKLESLDPVRAGWVRARLAEKRNDPAEAENEYRAAVEISHGRADAWVNLARFYRQARRFDQMEDTVRHVMSAPMKQPSALMDAAEVLLRSEHAQPLAAQLLRRYLSSSASFEDAPAFRAHYLLGTLNEQAGDKEGAAREYRTALSLVKSYALAQVALDRVNRQIAEAW